jgi:hypothetical protein
MRKQGQVVSPWPAIAALALAAGCMGTSRALIPSAPALAISNANRPVGLVLLAPATNLTQTLHLLLPKILGL